ncbi:MAG TPA: PAS domain-containing protein, partial [Verrucomicrobiae bacterium]|nr:PAS domain-containing protein [Verrucomicrobiae bacterium]
MKNGTIKAAVKAGGAGQPWPVGLDSMADLFDHVPDIVFFVKDSAGRYLAVNRALAERCGADERQALIGRKVSDVFPPALAARYAAQDAVVLRSGRPIL